MGIIGGGGAFGQLATAGIVLVAGCGETARPAVLGVFTPGADVPIVDAASTPAVVPDGGCAPFVSPPGRSSSGFVSAPVTLVDNLAEASDVVVDDANIFWSAHQAGTIHRAPRAGGSPVVVASGETLVDSLTIDRGTLYWMSGDFERAALRRMPATGVPETVGRARRVGVGGRLNHRIAFDETHVYWADIGDDPFVNGSISRAPKAGGPAEVIVSGLHLPTSIALDRCNLYWINYGERSGTGLVMTFIGDLATMPLAGGTVRTLAGSLVNAVDVAVDADSVYWSVRRPGPSTGAIYRLRKSGGVPRTLDEGLFLPPRLALDARTLYTIDRGIRVIPLGGGSPRDVADDYSSSSESGLIVDARGLYFAHPLRNNTAALSFLAFSP